MNYSLYHSNYASLRWYRDSLGAIRLLARYGGQWRDMYPMYFPAPRYP